MDAKRQRQYVSSMFDDLLGVGHREAPRKPEITITPFDKLELKKDRLCVADFVGTPGRRPATSARTSAGKIILSTLLRE
jgi:hypothetical protein